MTTQPPWTVARLLTWATDWLGSKGSLSPRLDAELLLGEALQAQRLDLYLNFDKPADSDELARFKKLIARRARGEPVAYILGRKGFHAIELAVGPGVLVPRPETEYLVDAVLERVGPDGPWGPVLDLGTGSGAIALALAFAWRDLPEPPEMIASDVSPAALDYARRNAAQLELAGRVTFVEAEGPEALIERGPFAVVVSNPPYVRADALASLQRDVVDFEPHRALVSGADGLDLLRRIARSVPALLRPGGIFACELGSPGQGQEVASLLRDGGLLDAVHVPIGPGPTSIVTASRPCAPALAAVV